MGEMREGGAIHTEGDWFAGGGSWVSTDHPIDGEIGGSDNVEYYGGHLIGESISSCNIPIISAAPDMFKALIAVRKKLLLVGLSVPAVYSLPSFIDELSLIDAALKKAVTRVPVPANVSSVSTSVDVVLEPEKPPLGLMPRQMWLENRRDDIYDAIARYRAAGKGINCDWLKELIDLDDATRPF